MHESSDFEQVCVVIPTYNRAAFLARTLQAIEGQNCGVVEVAICDDASSDDTPAVLSDFSKVSRHRVLQVRNETNNGAGYSFLRAAALGRSSYLLALGDDDILAPNHVLKLKRQICASPKNVAVFARDKGLRPVLNVLRSWVAFAGKSSGGAAQIALLLSGNSITGPGALFRSEVMATRPMHATNFLAQDLELWLHLSLKGFAVHSLKRVDCGRTAGAVDRVARTPAHVDLGLTIRRFLSSSEFKSFSEALGLRERERMISVFRKQLLYFEKTNPVAFQIAAYGTEFSPPNYEWDRDLTTAVVEIISRLDVDGGLSRSDRTSAIELVDSFAARTMNQQLIQSAASGIYQRSRLLFSSIAATFRPLRLRTMSRSQ